MALKIANTAVVDDSGNFVGEFGGLVVNNRLVFPDPLSPQQGSISGYSSGGTVPPNTVDGTIQKFPFTSDTNSSDVGELTQARTFASGQSSSVSGYTSAGAPPPSFVDTIDKFPFAADASASDVGELTNAVRRSTGQSSSTSGYVSGGDAPGPVVDTIQKFPFAADANATDVGELTICAEKGAGQSSFSSGYFSGGCDGTTTLLSSQIQKFPFASDTSSTNIGTLFITRMEASGQSSELFGYSSGGYVPESPAPPFGTRCDTIDKFSFSSDASATDVGNLTQNRGRTAGHSSTSSGYASGGIVPADSPLGPFARLNTIDKFPFAADANATDVGDLLNTIGSSAGQQSGGNA